MSELWPTCIGCGGETKTHSYFVTGDTIISHHSYKKIMCAEIRYNGTDTMFFCAAREDTVNQIVYIKCGDQDERMLYSFRLDSGTIISSDTSYVGEKISSITERIVKSVDGYDFFGFFGKRVSVATIHKHSNMNFVPYEVNTEVWYEGIGDLTNFFGLGNDNDILCYWNDGNQIYSNPERNACVITEYRPHTGLDKPTQIDSWHWQEVEYHFDSEFPNGEAKVLINYWIRGDTVFKGISYKKLYREIVYSDKHIYADGIFFCKGIREDEQERIYVCDNESKPELVLYDFSNWNIGDSLFIDRGNGNISSAIVTANNLDSVQLQDGSFARTFIGFSSFKLIRGIGFANGFLFPITVFPGSLMSSMIVSFYKGDKLIWKNPDYVGLKNPTSVNALKAYTSEGRLIVETPANASRLEVYSLDGSIRHTCFAQAGQLVKTSPLPPGMYIYKVIDKGGSVISNNKIVVN